MKWGLLIRDEDPSGGYQTFSRSDDDTGYTVTKTTALDRTTTFRMEDLPTGERMSRKDFPDGTWNETIYHLDGGQTTTYCDDTVVWMKHGPDPRFGMQAPVMEELTTTSPDGLVSTMLHDRTVDLNDPDDVLSLQTMEDQITINGRLFQYHFDAATRVRTKTTPEDHVSQNTLDEKGRVIEVDMAAGIEPVLIAYDEFGRVTSAAQGTQSWAYTYDKYRMTSRTDASGKQIIYGYDDADRMIRKELPEGGVIEYGYDQNGNRTQVVMPSDAEHSLGYTLRNQLASYAPPGNTGISYAYDLDKALTGTTLASGKTITNTFDEKGLWTGTSYMSATVARTYPLGCNKLETMTRTPSDGGTAQEVAYTYDGRLVTGVSFDGIAVGDYSYLYNNDFFLTQIDFNSDPDTHQDTITWNDDGLMTSYGPFSLTRSGPDGTVSRIDDNTLDIDFAYDSLGRVQIRTVTVNGTSVYSCALTRDTVGKITQKVETVSGTTETYAYGYDADIQLESVTRDSVPVEAYTYDVNGNRLTTLSSTASYDGQDRLQSLGATSYTFDTDGYLNQRGDAAFIYSALGELLEVDMGDGTILSYAYDGHRRRVGRTDAGGTWQYFYGNPYNLFQITAMRNPTGQLMLLYYDAEGFLFALDLSGTLYYVATDQMGSPRVVTDASGTVVKVVTYDSFGQITNDTNPAFDMPIGFAGGLADPVSGLVRFGFRDYEPAAGRWTARDPILFDSGQANLFVYVGNNPVNLRDPMGLWCVGASGYAGVGGGVELCCNNGKCSLCGEIGLGLGVSGSVGSGDAKETGSKVASEANASCGPLKRASNANTATSVAPNVRVRPVQGPIK